MKGSDTGEYYKQSKHRWKGTVAHEHKSLDAMGILG